MENQEEKDETQKTEDIAVEEDDTSKINIEEEEEYFIPDEAYENTEKKNTEEAKKDVELLETENVNIFDEFENIFTEEVTEIDEKSFIAEIALVNTALPNIPPSEYKTLADDNETLDKLSGGSDLASVTNVFATSNSDMDNVFGGHTNETHKNKALFKDGDKSISFFAAKIKTKATEKDSFLDILDNSTNLGIKLMVPLWNSGIWVALKSIDETQIIALKHLVAEKEKTIGASTGAAVYSNQSVLYAKDAIDLFINNIIFSSVKTKNKEELKKLILSSDLNSIYNGLGMAMYPDGVNYYFNCNNYIKGKERCDNVVKAKIRLQNCIHVDWSSLSDAQLYHMAKKIPNSMTIKEVLAYQAEFSDNTISKEYDYTSPDGKKYKLLPTYKIPSIYEYVIQGEFWVNKLTKTASMIMSKSDKVKDNFKLEGYSTQMKTNLLGGYIHYFKDLTIITGEGQRKTTTSIHELYAGLERFSKDISLYDKILNDIINLIRNSTIVVIGNAEYTCEKCEKINNNNTVDSDSVFKNIIPFNVLQILFTLGDLRYNTILNRG